MDTNEDVRPLDDSERRLLLEALARARSTMPNAEAMSSLDVIVERIEARHPAVAGCYRRALDAIRENRGRASVQLPSTVAHREIDFGWWRERNGQNARLTWLDLARDDGARGLLYLVHVPGGPGNEETIATCTLDDARSLAERAHALEAQCPSPVDAVRAAALGIEPAEPELCSVCDGTSTPSRHEAHCPALNVERDDRCAYCDAGLPHDREEHDASTADYDRRT